MAFVPPRANRVVATGPADIDLDVLPCAAYTIEAPSARIVGYNERAVELWGRAPAPGDRFCGSLRLFRPDGTLVPHQECPMAQAIEGAECTNGEIIVERPDGSMATLLVNISVLRDATGRITGALNVMQDITARHKSDMLLRGQKAVLEMIVRGESLTRVLESLTQIVERQAYGRAIASIFLLYPDGKRLKHGAAPNLPDSYNQAVDGIEIGPNVGTCATAAYTGQPVVTEDIDAAPSWAPFKQLPLGLGLRAAWSMPIHSSTGKVLGTFGTYFREVRRPTDAEFDAVELLAHTAALAIERQRYEDDQREAAQRKDEFLAMLAHELRNPLTAIRTAAALLRLKGGDPGTVQRTHQIIERQTRNMAHLLDDLLDVSRITRGMIELSLDRVDIVRLANQSLEAVSAQQEARGHRSRLTAPPEAIFVQGDPTRLEQVLVNLLTNAIKYTDPGGSIDVEITADDAEVSVCVRDNGKGIPTELLPRVFDLFVQDIRSLDRTQGGLGIGLTIVRRLVEMHGGTVTARSNGVGQGSEFIVTLPRLHQPPRAATTVPDMPRCTRRVVVIEDQHDTAHMIAELLRALSHDVMVAHDGPSGLALIEQWHPEVVLIDIGLPGMDGYEIAEHIRRGPPVYGTPTLIAVTGYSQPSDRERARSSGFDHHLTKPVEPETLDIMIRTLGFTEQPIAST